MRSIFHFLIIFFISYSLFAHSDRYRLVITDDPATTITIGWDQVSGEDPMVYYGEDDGGTNADRYSIHVSPKRIIEFRGMSNHFVKLTNLEPDTNYYFLIKDSEGVSKRLWFRTAPDKNNIMSFVCGGDSRNNRVPRVNANKMVSRLKPTAVFFGGDMTNSDSDNEWIEWFDDWQHTIASDGRMFPVIPTRGNHERANSTIYNLFDVPSKNAYYAITFGRNLYTLYTLNSEIAAGGDQLEWLKKELHNNRSKWKSAQYHKPMRPHQSRKSEGDDEYNNWAQLFYKHKVNLVFESDSHVVKTTYPIKPCDDGEDCEEGFTRDDDAGTVYVGEGCWGAPTRPNDDDKSWTRNSGSFNQIKYVTVTRKSIRLHTIMVDYADKVSENPNDVSPGLLPSGTLLWQPSSGGTVTIR